MTITTKLKIGDYVFFLKYGKIQKRQIERINAITDGENQQVLYEVMVKNEPQPEADMGLIEDLENQPQPTERKMWLSEKDVYITKEDLFNSLLEESK
jgi:hypothetical protein